MDTFTDYYRWRFELLGHGGMCLMVRAAHTAVHLPVHVTKEGSSNGDCLSRNIALHWKRPSKAPRCCAVRQTALRPDT